MLPSFFPWTDTVLMNTVCIMLAGEWGESYGLFVSAAADYYHPAPLKVSPTLNP